MLDKFKQMFTAPPSAGVGIASLAPQEAVEALGQPGVVMIDVREPDEFRNGHVKGAKLMPLGTIAHRWHELTSYQNVLVICHTGSRSLLACRQLTDLGVPQVVNVDGGLIAWAHEKLPIQH